MSKNYKRNGVFDQLDPAPVRYVYSVDYNSFMDDRGLTSGKKGAGLFFR